MWLLGPPPGTVGCGLGCAPEPANSTLLSSSDGRVCLAEAGRWVPGGYSGEGGVREVFQKEAAVCLSVPAAACHRQLWPPQLPGAGLGVVSWEKLH